MNINNVLSPFKIGSSFSSQDRLPDPLKSFLVDKSTCSGCQSPCIGETRCHLATRMNEPFVMTKSHTY